VSADRSRLLARAAAEAMYRAREDMALGEAALREAGRASSGSAAAGWLDDAGRYFAAAEAALGSARQAAEHAAQEASANLLPEAEG
jgi:hypothetical protein